MNNKAIPITRQCELLSLNQSSFYYQPVPVSDFNLRLMELIDRQYTKDPAYGVPRMTTWLKKQGYQVNRKRIARLMGQLTPWSPESRMYSERYTSGSERGCGRPTPEREYGARSLLLPNGQV